MKKIIIVAVLLTTLVLGVSGFGSDTNPFVNFIKTSLFSKTLSMEKRSEKIDENSQKTSVNSTLTDEVAFDMFFIKVVSLESVSAKAKAKGKSGNLYHNYMKQHGFTANEISIIRQVAKEHADEIAPLHAKALQIIRKGREELAKGNSLPPPPPELAELQQQRNEIVIRNKNKLQNLLGSETTQKVKFFMNSISTRAEINPSDLMNSDERIERLREKSKIKLNRTEGEQND